MKRSFTLYLPQNWSKKIFVLLLVIVSNYSFLQAQCNGFDVTVDAPPWYSYCVGDPIDLIANPVGGTQPYSYSWSTGGTAQIETIPGPATSMNIYVTVTDANGCEAVSFAHIKPINFNPTIFASEPVCEFIGQVELSVSGPSDFLYLWSTGETTQSIFVNQTGLYEVTVTHAVAGCTQVLSIEPEFYPLPEAQIVGDMFMCPDKSTTLEVVGDDYVSILWSTGETGPSIEVFGPGPYTVTVYDENDCPADAQAEVILFPIIPPAVVAPPLSCPDDDNLIEIANDGDFTSFEWSTGETTSSIIGITGETYVVTVTDGNGCTVGGLTYIDQYPLILPFECGRRDPPFLA